MKLLDHFRPPLSETRHWESFHSIWAAAMADALNRDLLPPDYFAEIQVHVGSRVEVDVATFDERQGGESTRPANGGGTATLPVRAWVPSAPDLTMPALFPDSLEVLVFSTEAGPSLVAAVELVSPGNKDREESRRLFAAKCASYLQQGIGLVFIDIVTNRGGCPHDDIIRTLEADAEFLLPSQPLWATAYHPVRRGDEDQIEIWTSALAVGQDLPIVPLPLDKSQFVPLELAATYTEACQQSRLRLPS